MTIDKAHTWHKLYTVLATVAQLKRNDKTKIVRHCC